MAAYYNEIDPFAAQWLRNLISAGHIAPGDVDERSITEIKPNELKQYTQCHFFAGVGVWSYALRRSGWRDSRPVWTGSCPCQPFSAAGKGKGTEDERHLWPVWFELVSECQPSVIFGEQVASSEVVGKSDGTGENVWIDIVQADMERALYTFAPFDLPAAGFGAPHIRQRLWFVAESLGNASNARLQGYGGFGKVEIPQRWKGKERLNPATGGASRLGHASIEPSERDAREFQETQGEASGEGRADGDVDNGHSDAGEVSRLANNEKEQRYGGGSRNENDGEIAPNNCPGSGVAHANGRDSSPERQQRGGEYGQQQTNSSAGDELGSAGADKSFWSSSDWIGCRDGKFRPVESSTFPLANGATQRVGRLRAYGNAICAEVATGFITAYMGNN